MRRGKLVTVVIAIGIVLILHLMLQVSIAAFANALIIVEIMLAFLLADSIRDDEQQRKE
jgi:hypothetical protein